jgi:hypothetical protein
LGCKGKDVWEITSPKTGKEHSRDALEALICTLKYMHVSLKVIEVHITYALMKAARKSQQPMQHALHDLSASFVLALYI